MKNKLWSLFKYIHISMKTLRTNRKNIECWWDINGHNKKILNSVAIHSPMKNKLWSLFKYIQIFSNQIVEPCWSCSACLNQPQKYEQGQVWSSWVTGVWFKLTPWNDELLNFVPLFGAIYDHPTVSCLSLRPLQQGQLPVSWWFSTSMTSLDRKTN